MKDTNHYIVTGDEGNIEIHTRNIPEANATKAIKTGVECFVRDAANGIVLGHVFNVSDTVDLYRRMCEAEVKKMLSNGGLVNDYAHTHKWVSESLKKTLEFQNNGVPEAVQRTEKIVQMVIDKKFYTNFREELIPQLGSSGSAKSIYNYEGFIPGRIKSLETYQTIPSSAQRNVGVYSNDVKTVNEKIASIHVLDPNDPMVKNGFLRYLSTNKLKVGMLALSITIDVTSIVLCVIEDGYRFGKSTKVTLCNLVGSKAGAAIGAAICSIIPGVGTMIGGILGGMIFGFVGTKVGELWCGLSPEVTCAPGPGAPDPGYLQFIYGGNQNFALPLPKYDLDSATSLPKIVDESTGRVVSQQDTSSVYGIPKSSYDDPSVYGSPPSQYQ